VLRYECARERSAGVSAARKAAAEKQRALTGAVGQIPLCCCAELLMADDPDKGILCSKELDEN